jgi:ceramide glucosyltransferase
MKEREPERPARAEIGLVNCFYRLANPSTLAMQWEAIAINADFWSQVLQSASFRKLDFALGAVMAMRRQALKGMGGFTTLANCLADDYQLGNRMVRNGYRIELCPAVVECWSERMGWRDVWKHQLRWARTIRVCQPWPYFFSILSNVTLWALMSLVLLVASAKVVHSTSWTTRSGAIAVTSEIALPMSPFLPAAYVLARILVAHNLQKRLARTNRQVAPWWLVPVKDLLQAALWLGAFAGNKIEWRGERFRLRRDGTLVDDSSEAEKRRALA